MSHIELSARAVRDLRGIDAVDRSRIRAAFISLARGAESEVKALAGRSPWLRGRVGDYRYLYRPLTAEELDSLGRTEPSGWLVARVVHRSDLDQAVRGL